MINQSQGSSVHNIPIIFSEDVHHPNCDALIVTLLVINKCFHQILIDNWSSTDILFMSTFVQIKLERLRLKPYATPLHGFVRGSIVSKGVIKITVSFGKSPTKVTTIVNFIIVD